MTESPDLLERIRALLEDAERHRDAAVPFIVRQALSDRKGLTKVERLAMWEMRAWVDNMKYRDVYAEALASLMDITDQAAGRVLRRLAARGYLDESAKKRPRAYRFYLSRRAVDERAA